MHFWHKNVRSSSSIQLFFWGFSWGPSLVCIVLIIVVVRRNNKKTDKVLNVQSLCCCIMTYFFLSWAYCGAKAVCSEDSYLWIYSNVYWPKYSWIFARLIYSDIYLRFYFPLEYIPTFIRIVRFQQIYSNVFIKQNRTFYAKFFK